MNEKVRRQQQYEAVIERGECPTPSKHGYHSRAEAKRNRKTFARGNRSDERALRAYKCVCGMFHLGHLPKSAIRNGRSAVAKPDGGLTRTAPA